MQAQMKCRERAGFLFDHQCGELAGQQCDICGKQVCERHAHQKDGSEEYACSRCARMLPSREQAQYGTYQASAYHSSYTYYEGYGTYDAALWGSRHLGHDDFTDGDSGSFEGNDLDGYEADLGGS